jgi:hypothetical protein
MSGMPKATIRKAHETQTISFEWGSLTWFPGTQSMSNSNIQIGYKSLVTTSVMHLVSA